MIRRPPRSTQSRSSAASDVYKRQFLENVVVGDDGVLGQLECDPPIAAHVDKAAKSGMGDRPGREVEPELHVLGELVHRRDGFLDGGKLQIGAATDVVGRKKPNVRCEDRLGIEPGPVSYTHLTLPTN